MTILLATVPRLEAQSGAESRLRTERETLDRLRREREQLQQRRLDLQTTVHDLSEEVTNLDRQADMTRRLVRSLDQQLVDIHAEVSSAGGGLARAEDELTVKRAILRRRLIDIYKRGALHSAEVMLSANSFGQLVARYKYLHLATQRDREMVSRVVELRNKITAQRGSLVRYQQSIEQARADKTREEQRFRDLEREREVSLARAKRSAEETDARLRRIAGDERRLSNVLASLEVSRRREARANPSAPLAPSTLRTSDLGRLDWPVEGGIIYTFGRVVNPNNTTTRWNGIGIRAPEGTPVRSVAAGRVVVAAPFGTYGQTVIVQHGGGDYSVYGSLGRIQTRVGEHIGKSQVLGLVGSANPGTGPHLHFEIRPQGRAVDPLEWLRGSR